MAGTVVGADDTIFLVSLIVAGSVIEKWCRHGWNGLPCCRPNKFCWKRDMILYLLDGNYHYNCYTLSSETCCWLRRSIRELCWYLVWLLPPWNQLVSIEPLVLFVLVLVLLLTAYRLMGLLPYILFSEPLFSTDSVNITTAFFDLPSTSLTWWWTASKALAFSSN